MAGRKRAFDREIALDKAMRVFWNNGFAGTSVSNLTSELGINTPSLYAAFGNKEQLFKEVMSHYSTHYVSRHYKNLIGESELSFKERLEVCFSGLIALFTDGETPLGCLLVKSVNESESVAFPEEASNYIKEVEVQSTQVLIDLFSAEIAPKDIPENTSIEIMVNYLLAVFYGLAVQARSGQSKEALNVSRRFFN